MVATYDVIGATYAERRRADPRLATAISAALGDARVVVNVGAGAGSYEPTDRQVVAVDSSAVMLAQRPRHAAPAVRARAEALPFIDEAVDATLAVLTVHHWADQFSGLAECARIARERVVVLTWDPASDGFWLARDYFPDLLALDRQIFPSLETFAACLGPVSSTPVPIPADCIDGFLGAFWQHPEAYLDPAVRSGMSSFSRLADVEGRLQKLARDLASGAWKRRYAPLLEHDSLDIGYRLVVANRSMRGAASYEASSVKSHGKD